MFTVRKANERGHANYGWLDTYHTFSFNTYHDPNHHNFRSLRVMNEDVVQPGQGFGTHPHRDMEIVTYVLKGALEHRDSMGNGEVLRPGEFQRMSAGTGITHSEFNPSATEPVHLYQIWLMPEAKGLKPSYEQKAFHPEKLRNQWCLVAAQEAKDGSLSIHQDASIYLSRLDADTMLTFEFLPQRFGWLQVLRGEVQMPDHDVTLSAGDGLAISAEKNFRIQANTNAEVMLFDLS